jgi:chromate transport protein ChrA
LLRALLRVRALTRHARAHGEEERRAVRTRLAVCFISVFCFFFFFFYFVVLLMCVLLVPVCRHAVVWKGRCCEAPDKSMQRWRGRCTRPMKESSLQQ